MVGIGSSFPIPPSSSMACFCPRSRPLSCAKSCTCTISGLSLGRPFALKIAFTALLLVASAPNPYTVSVGNATGMSVVASSSAARRMRSKSGPSVYSMLHSSTSAWLGG
jgi:hypothetical protein